MDKKINNNGHPYVDLGLPSGTLWATCNVGANKPSESGLYFQWGDTKGYSNEQIGKDKQFTWKDYKWNIDGGFSKYTKEESALDLEDDAVNANMGGNWHIPSPEQFRELLDNTTSTWATQDEINGFLFASKKDKSKSIFIPAVGYAWDGSISFTGIYGSIWASKLHKYSVTGGYYAVFVPEGAHLNSYGGWRSVGMPVRGVIG